MNKAQAKQFEMAKQYICDDMNDNAARILSAMIRAAMVRKTAHKIHQFAVDNGLHVNPEFRI